MNVPVIKAGRYQHYKGNNYEVLGAAMHSETREFVVVYKALYKGDFPEGLLWVRPFGMFTEEIEIQGRKVPRFRYIGDE